MDGPALRDRIDAPATWRRVDCVSDVHLHAQDPATARAWLSYLAAAPFDALLILGDLFEVWVGDDVLTADPALDPEIAFAQAQAGAIGALARRRPVYVMHGNRDFLLGAAFAAATGVERLADPTRLEWGGVRWLLSHGDAWCLDDGDYQAFRAEVRAAPWQAAFLAQPLPQRLQQARALRERSQAHQARQRASGRPPTDVDAATAARAVADAGAAGLIHGHTHRPGAHRLPGGAWRLVLSDWDAAAHPARLQVLSLDAQGGWQARALPDALAP